MSDRPITPVGSPLVPSTERTPVCNPFDPLEGWPEDELFTRPADTVHPLVTACVHAAFCRHPDAIGPSLLTLIFEGRAAD